MRKSGHHDKNINLQKSVTFSQNYKPQKQNQGLNESFVQCKITSFEQNKKAINFIIEIYQHVGF